MPFVADKTISLIKKLATYLKGVFEFDYSIVNETDNFLISVYDILSQKVKNDDLDLVEITHITNDSNFISLLIKYFIENIENYTNLSLKQSMAFVGYFEKLKIETFDKIMTLIPFNSKVRFTDYYMNDRYESKELLSHPRDFVIDFASWLKKNIFNIKNVSDSISQTIAYAAYKEVNKGLKILFMDKITSFNMIDIGNIR